MKTLSIATLSALLATGVLAVSCAATADTSRGGTPRALAGEPLVAHLVIGGVT